MKNDINDLDYGLRVSSRVSKLVAEECAKIVESMRPKNGVIDRIDGFQALTDAANAIRKEFGIEGAHE